MTSTRRSFLQFSAALATSKVFPGWLSLGKADPRKLCNKLTSDPLRPQFHLLPPSNWMNDPNGPIFFRDQYHMFHQYNPDSAVWGNMHWAHAVSPDMVHWKHEPIAIAPTPNGYDRAGVFSGSAVLNKGVPTVIYTGVAPPDSASEATLRDGKHVWREVQCLAISRDPMLRTWEKLPQPIIAAPPPGISVTGFRDPALWQEADTWWLILGSGTREKGGMILLYRSTDLRNWTYVHPMIEAGPSAKSTTNPVDDGDMWECPDFFPLGNKHVLLISTKGKVRWKVGSYKDLKFTPEKEGVVDHGSYYAAKSMLDRDGNRILWGWIPETRPEAEHAAAGWAGVMSLPRTLSLTPGGELAMQVSPAVRALRRGHTSFSNNITPVAMQNAISNIRVANMAAEFSVDLRPAPGKTATLQLITERNEPFADISVEDSSSKREVNVNGIVAPVSGPSGSPFRLHAFLDGSVLEVFVNETTSITARIYRNPAGPLKVHLEGNPVVANFDIRQIEPISNNRLTSPLCG
jgi:beta-fructofuranosidase